MKQALILLALALIAFPALAQNASVNNSGDIRLSGKISAITRDSFIITHDGGTSEVMFSSMNSKNIEKMREANILQDGSYVTVEGKLKDGPFNRAVVAADNIYVQGPVDTVD